MCRLDSTQSRRGILPRSESGCTFFACPSEQQGRGHREAVGCRFYMLGQLSVALRKAIRTACLGPAVRLALPIFFAVMVLAGPLPTLHAAFTVSGDVEPANPPTWTSSTLGYVGKTANGSLTVDSGDDLLSSYGWIGYGSGKTGAVTVDGTGSTWTNNSLLYVGYSGNGTLNLSGGGAVTVNDTTYVAYGTGSTGTINFGTGGGTLTTRTLCSSPSRLTGTGAINVHGFVSDVDLVFDSTHGLNQTFTYNQSGQNVTLNLDMASVPSNNGDLGVGWKGNGSLNIQDGVAVNSRTGYIGYISGSTGVATITGANSTWTNSWNLYVGQSGNGTLNIEDGGTLINSGGGGYASYVGSVAGSKGTVTVDGTGSKWTSSSNLYVGSAGNGTLKITGGGAVSSGSSSIGASSGSTGIVTVDGNDSTWNTSGLYVGNLGAGTLNITGGATVSSGGSSIGYSSMSANKVTVDGTRSMWNTSGLTVGYSGNGTLNITGGGAVSVTGETFLACNAGSTGTISFGAGGGTLTTQTLYFASPTQLAGNGTINAHGLVSDVDLVFDSTHGLNQTFRYNQSGQNVTLNLDMASAQSSNGDLGAGWRGNGSLNIRGGVTVNSQSGRIGYSSGSTGVVTVAGTGSKWTNSNSSDLYVGQSGNGTLNVTGGAAVSNGRSGYLGYNSSSTGAVTVIGAGSTWNNGGSLEVGFSGSGTLKITGSATVSDHDGGEVGDSSGSMGVVTVDGTGSTWTDDSWLDVGRRGTGTLNVTGGGTVRSGYAYDAEGSIGDYPGSKGVATVDGTGSKWNISSYLNIGRLGNGTLNVTGGGVVTTSNVSINSQSLLTIDVGNGSVLNVGNGSGTFTNGGSVRISAGCEHNGGRLFAHPGRHVDRQRHLPSHRRNMERRPHVYRLRSPTWHVRHVRGIGSARVITDTATGWSIGTSFATPVTLTATAISGGTRTALETLLAHGQSVLGGWDFTGITGYTSGDPVYLSFGIGPGHDRNGLQLWHYNGTSWNSVRRY